MFTSRVHKCFAISLQACHVQKPSQAEPCLERLLIICTSTLQTICKYTWHGQQDWLNTPMRCNCLQVRHGTLHGQHNWLYMHQCNECNAHVHHGRINDHRYWSYNLAMRWELYTSRPYGKLNLNGPKELGICTFPRVCLTQRIALYFVSRLPSIACVPS